MPIRLGRVWSGIGGGRCGDADRVAPLLSILVVSLTGMVEGVDLWLVSMFDPGSLCAILCILVELATQSVSPIEHC